jgi:endonuclease/exonuclease/phosphatase family metal-dependent hydrolase
MVRFRGISFANVHLSHGQFLNRWQLLHIAGALDGPAAIIGDFNAVGPTVLQGFRDIGPRRRTHRASNIVNLRLDRCLARDIRLAGATVLDRGASDHHPIVLDLAVAPEQVEGGALLAF